MDPLACARSFVARCENDDPIDQLAPAFELALQHLGFRYFACVSHTDPSVSMPGAVQIHNYPDPWVRYIDSQIHTIDAVLSHAERSPLPFFWESAEIKQQLTLEQKGVLIAARSFGLENGYTIPIHVPRLLGIPSGSCSVVPAIPSISPSNYFAVSLMAPYLLKLAARSASTHLFR